MKLKMHQAHENVGTGQVAIGEQIKCPSNTFIWIFIVYFSHTASAPVATKQASRVGRVCRATSS